MIDYTDKIPVSCNFKPLCVECVFEVCGFFESAPVNRSPVTETDFSGCSSAWLERLLWEQEAVGSNPITPIIEFSFLPDRED